MRGERAAALACASALLWVQAAAAPGPALARSPAPPPAAAVVRMPLPQDDGTLTPYTFQLAYPLLTLVYDTLLWRDADGVPQPWLARSVEPSSDGRRLTVRLVDGVRWHDGEPFTSADVAFTFGLLRGRPQARFTPQLAALERVDTPDLATVSLTLRHPSPGFLDQPLADVPILPAHLWRDLPRGRQAPEGLAVGTGPYRLVDHAAGQRYRFEANADYFRGAPAVAAIEVPVIADATDTLHAFQRRDLDVLAASLPAGEVDRVAGFGTVVRRGPSYKGTVLMFNLRAAPFDRPEVRQAVARSLDLRAMARAVGEAVPAERGYLHPDSGWAPTESLHRFEPDGARSALVGLGPVDVLVADNDPVLLEAAHRVAAALEGAGVDAAAHPLPRSELGRAVGEDGGGASFQLAIWTSPPLASYDPDGLRLVFGSDPTTAPLNFAGYRSPAFDAFAERIAAERDPTARRGVVADAVHLLAEDAPVVPLFFSNGAYAYHPAAYDGWVFVKGSGILDKRSFVEPAVPTRPAASVLPTPRRRPSRLPLVGMATAGVLAGIGLVLRRR